MGQDTDCDIGIAYRCNFTAENYTLIQKLVRIDKMHVYMDYGDCDDEKRDISDAIHTTTKPDKVENYDELLKELKHNIEYHHFGSNDEYEGKLDGLELIFHCVVISGYARNISRRRNPTIFNEINDSPRDTIKRFEKALSSFIDLGIKEKDLECGSLMSDW